MPATVPRGNEKIPLGCSTFDGFDAHKQVVTYYWTPGSHMFSGKTDSVKFIKFYYNNTSRPHRVPWEELTGAEQFEWCKVWADNGKGHVKNEAATIGLRGTDLSSITDVETLDMIAPRSPSLKRRRPADSNISVEDWNSPMRRWDQEE